MAQGLVRPVYPVIIAGGSECDTGPQRLRVYVTLWLVTLVIESSYRVIHHSVKVKH